MTTLTLHTFKTNWFANAFHSYMKYRRIEKAARHTISELSKLSDKELNDIGINRGMIYAVAYEVAE